VLQRRYVEIPGEDRDIVRPGGGMMRLQSLLKRKGDFSGYMTSQRGGRTGRGQMKTGIDMLKQSALQGEKLRKQRRLRGGSLVRFLMKQMRREQSSEWPNRL